MDPVLPLSPYSPECVEVRFSEVRSPLGLVTGAVTLGRRASCRVALCHKVQGIGIEEQAGCALALALGLRGRLPGSP